MSNIACRIFAEQVKMLLSLPSQEEAKTVLYQAVINSLNQFENHFDNQIENQNENAYVSVSDSESLSILSKSILDLLSKNITWKEFSNNYGGKRAGAGKKPKKPSGKPKKNLAENENVNEIINKLEDILFKYHNRHFETKSWADSIDKMLRIDKVSFDDVIKNLDWYSEHIGEKYVPVIESGSSLREKYIKLENAIKREENTEKDEEQEESFNDWLKRSI